jgi:hypothetical protein
VLPLFLCGLRWPETLKNDRTSETLCPSVGFWLHLPRFVERLDCSKVATWCNYRFPSSRENAVIIASCGSIPKLNLSPWRPTARNYASASLSGNSLIWIFFGWWFVAATGGLGYVDDMSQAIGRARSCVPRSVACTIHHEVQFWPKTDHRFEEIYRVVVTPFTACCHAAKLSAS